MATEGSMYYQVALHAVLLLQYQSQACVVGQTPPLMGYRCDALSETNQITKLFSLEECTLACVRWNNCIVLNYNSDLRLCVLSSAHCTESERSMAITIRAFHPSSERHRCLSWKWYTGMFPTAATGGVITHNPTYSHAVARGKLNSALLVGQLYAESSLIWAAAYGVVHQLAIDLETLSVDISCSVVWVDYLAGQGQQLPFGAIVGGHDVDGTLLYAASGWYFVNGNMDKLAGYYHPVRDKLVIPGATEITRYYMQILVLLWFE